jgi:hypothetical protein
MAQYKKKGIVKCLEELGRLYRKVAKNVANENHGSPDLLLSPLLENFH